MSAYLSFADAVGKTPLIELGNINKQLNLKGKLFAKVEGMNPSGSAKDRVALEMVLDAEKRSLLSVGGTIIEPTSGNTGIGLAAVAVPKGYRVIIVMPDTMSKERIMMIKAYGAEVVLTKGELGMSGAIAEAERLFKEIPGSFIPDQFKNPANVAAHYKTTGPEIFSDMEAFGGTDIFVAGVGTGGTISGIGKYLKEKNANVKTIAIEPKSSPVLSGGKPGSHGLQGIGANFIPEIVDMSVIDEIVAVSEDEAFDCCRLLAKAEGVLAGISSGAALYAAIETAKKNESCGKNIVVLLPDSGTRYLSTNLFQE